MKIPHVFVERAQHLLEQAKRNVSCTDLDIQQTEVRLAELRAEKAKGERDIVELTDFIKATNQNE